MYSVIELNIYLFVSVLGMKHHVEGNDLSHPCYKSPSINKYSLTLEWPHCWQGVGPC